MRGIKHARIRRSIITEDLEERDPSLIDLKNKHVIPILGPLLTIVVGGEPTTAAIVATTTEQQTTAQTTASTASAAADPGTTTTAGGPSESSGSGGGSNAAAGDGGNAASSDSSADQTTSQSLRSSVSSANDPGASDTKWFPTSHASSISTSSSTQPFVANAGGSPTSGTEVETSGFTFVTNTVFSSSMPLSTQSSSTGQDGGDGGGDDSGSPPSSDAVQSHHTLTVGAILAITVAILLALLAAFCFSRQYVRKKRERRREWWLSYQARQDSSTNGWMPFKSNASGRDVDCLTTRSSFATTFEYGVPDSPGWEIVLPPFPAMAEIRDAHTSVTLSHGQMSAATSVPVTPVGNLLDISPPPSALIPISTPQSANGATEGDKRTSVNSLGSSSEGHSQQVLAQPSPDLFVRPSGNYSAPTVDFTHPFPSPMSVRPFSPTESFCFPTPPSDDDLSRRDSTQSSSVAQPGTPRSLPPTPGFHLPTGVGMSNPKPSPVADPFSDPPTPKTPVVIVTPPPAPLPSPHEFTDDGVSVIRQPFQPMLRDEIAVDVGEKVRVSRVFDDGWVRVAKLPATDTGKGKERQVEGLIPVDCLREAGEKLPVLVERRVVMHSLSSES